MELQTAGNFFKCFQFHQTPGAQKVNWLIASNENLRPKMKRIQNQVKYLRWKIKHRTSKLTAVNYVHIKNLFEISDWVLSKPLKQKASSINWNLLSVI